MKTSLGQESQQFLSYDSGTLIGRFGNWYWRKKESIVKYLSSSETPIFVKTTNPHDTSSQTAAARPMIWDPRKLIADFIKTFAEPETPLYFEVLENPEFMQYSAWRAQIDLKNEFVERVFCQDLIWQVIQYGANVIEREAVENIFSAYQNKVDESFFKEIKNIISKFQDEANAYFKNHADKETGTLFVTLPNKMLREIIGKINASFDHYEKELSVEEIDENEDENEVEEKTFYQVAKESLQAGYHVLRKHPWKVIGAIASTTAIIYAGKRSDSTNFNPLTALQFPQWTTPSWQVTNAATMLVLGLSYIGGGPVLPYAMAGLALSMMRPVKADLTTGLVAYYPFNGNANDASGHGNDGSVYGAQLTTDRFGNPNDAYYFNGSTRIDVQRVNDFSFSNDEASITFWFTLDDLERNYNGMIGRENYQWILLQYNEGVTHQFRYWIDSDCSPGWSTTPTGTIVPKTDWVQGQWYFVAWIKTQNYVEVYIDGQLLLTVPWTGSVCNPTSPLHIGMGQLSGRSHLGKIDSLRICNRPLIYSEIQELYSLDDVMLNLTVPVDLTRGLVAHYPFDGDVKDMSGHGNHGTVLGATLTTDRFGYPNQAYYFNGSSMIDINRVNDFAFPNNEVSITLWFTLSDLNRNYDGLFGREVFQWILLMYNEMLNRALHYWIDSTCSSVWETTQTGTIIPNTAWVADQWYFMGWIKSKNHIEVYLNNISVSNLQWTGSMCNPTTPLHIGRGYNSARFHLGKIDDFRIYDRPLIYSEIQSLYEWQETSSTSSTSLTSTSSASSTSSTSFSTSTTMPTRSSILTLASSSSFFGSSNTLSTKSRSRSSSPAVSEDSGLELGWILLMIGEPIIAAIIFVPLFMIGMKCWRNKANAAHNGDSLELGVIPSTLPGNNSPNGAVSSRNTDLSEEYANMPRSQRPDSLPSDYANAPVHSSQSNQYGKPSV